MALLCYLKQLSQHVTVTHVGATQLDQETSHSYRNSYSYTLKAFAKLSLGPVEFEWNCKVHH